ncbi:MAG: DUF3040 domain-containing protein [Acidothermaceae bacterium]
MPLSEHEQRVLEQIERSLYADDPKFAATVRGIDPRTRQRRRYARAVIGFVLGLALLPVGIAVGYIQITFAAFLIALLAVVYGVATWRRGVERPEQATPAVAAPTGGRSRFRAPHSVRGADPKRPLIQRFEDRWNRRREQ